MGRLEIVFILLAFIIGLLIGPYILIDESLKESYNKVLAENDELRSKYETLLNEYSVSIIEDSIVQENSTAVTIVYYTGFTSERHSMTLAIPYEKYTAYHERKHPYWGIRNLTLPIEYITDNETIINEIVSTIRSQTKSEEDLANSLLDFVQYKDRTMSIRYYPTDELKYPIETLVEMGGDCDTHSLLYATLMKAAGFKVLVLFSNEKLSSGLHHVATAVHYSHTPSFPESIPQKAIVTYNGEEYYLAETTSWVNYVGEIDQEPESEFGNLTYQVVPIG